MNVTFWKISAILSLLTLFFILSFHDSSNAQQPPFNEQEQIRDLEYLHSLNEHIDLLITRGELDSVPQFIDEALQLSRLLNDRDAEAQAYLHFGNYYIDRLMPDSAIAVIEEPFSRLYDTSKGIELGNALASAYSRNENYIQSLQLQQNLLEKAQEENNRRMIAGISQNMAVNYVTLGDYTSAIDNYLNSLEMAEEMADTAMMVVVLDNLGGLNRRQGNMDIAERYISDALELAIEGGYLRNQLTSHLNLAIVQNLTERYYEAEQNLMRVVEIANQMGNRFSVIQAYNNLGDTYLGMGDYDRSLEMFEESLQMSRDDNITPGIFYNLQGLSMLYVELGEMVRAIEYLEEAREYAALFPSSDQLIPVLNKLAEFYAQSGDTSQAYSALTRYSALQDSLRQTERDQAVAMQEVLLGLRLERETREIAEEALLQERRNKFIIASLLFILVIILGGLIILFIKKHKANNLLRQKTKELAKANDDKDKLLSLLSHDLRTPLSGLQGVIELIRYDQINKDELNDALDHIDASLQKEINTLTNYLQWAKSQKFGISAQIEPFNLCDVAKDVVDESIKIAQKKGVAIENKLTDDLGVIADSQMTSIILRNLLSNAIKYTRKGDKILLDATVDSEKNLITLIVKDFGMGVDPKLHGHIFDTFNSSKEGTDGEIGTGLGLSLCKEFAEKQNGEIYFESEPGKGTTFFVTFKKA